MEHSQTYFLYFAILISVVALIVVIKEVYNIIQRKRRESFNYYKIDFLTSSKGLTHVEVHAKSEDKAIQLVVDNFSEGDSTVFILEVKDITDKVTGGNS